MSDIIVDCTPVQLWHAFQQVLDSGLGVETYLQIRGPHYSKWRVDYPALSCGGLVFHPNGAQKLWPWRWIGCRSIIHFLSGKRALLSVCFVVCRLNEVSELSLSPHSSYHTQSCSVTHSPSTCCPTCSTCKSISRGRISNCYVLISMTISCPPWESDLVSTVTQSALSKHRL